MPVDQHRLHKPAGTAGGKLSHIWGLNWLKLAGWKYPSLPDERVFIRLRYFAVIHKTVLADGCTVPFCGWMKSPSKLSSFYWFQTTHNINTVFLNSTKIYLCISNAAILLTKWHCWQICVELCGHCPLSSLSTSSQMERIRSVPYRPARDGAEGGGGVWVAQILEPWGAVGLLLIGRLDIHYTSFLRGDNVVKLGWDVRQHQQPLLSQPRRSLQTPAV